MQMHNSYRGGTAEEIREWLFQVFCQKGKSKFIKLSENVTGSVEWSNQQDNLRRKKFIRKSFVSDKSQTSIINSYMLDMNKLQEYPQYCDQKGMLVHGLSGKHKIIMLCIKSCSARTSAAHFRFHSSITSIISRSSHTRRPSDFRSQHFRLWYHFYGKF